MSIFDDTECIDDLAAAIGLLSHLVEFAESQQREGLIDGACDPDLFVHTAKELIAKYGGEPDDTDSFALQA